MAESVVEYTPSIYKIIHKTSVDFVSRPTQKPIHLVQYDTIPIIEVFLFLDGVKFFIPEVEDLEEDETFKVKVRWGKNSTDYIYKDVLGCNEDRDAVYFNIDSDMSNRHGIYNPIIEFIITSGEGESEISEKVGSSPIVINMERNPIQEESEPPQEE